MSIQYFENSGIINGYKVEKWATKEAHADITNQKMKQANTACVQIQWSLSMTQDPIVKTTKLHTHDYRCSCHNLCGAYHQVHEAHMST